MTKIIGIVGAGTMGAGIMINCVMNGHAVVLTDRDEDSLAKAEEKLTSYLNRQVQKGKIEGSSVARVKSLLTSTTDQSELAGASMIIEAVFEDLELKRKIFKDLEDLVPESTILASNTSCLRLADIASELRHKSRFCGLHYFSPAEINPIVELIELPETTAETLASSEEFLSKCGKEIIPCGDQSGFALNRFFCPYTNEAVRCLDEGLASVGQIDAIAQEVFGVALGPFAVMNIIGTGTNLNAVRNLAQLGPYYTVAKGLITKGESNAPWDIEDAVSPADQETSKLVAERLIGSVLLPVFEEIEEGTATLEAIELGASLAFRFEKTPKHLIEELGQTESMRLVNKLAAQHGHGAFSLQAAS